MKKAYNQPLVEMLSVFGNQNVLLLDSKSAPETAPERKSFAPPVPEKK